MSQELDDAAVFGEQAPAPTPAEAPAPTEFSDAEVFGAQDAPTPAPAVTPEPPAPMGELSDADVFGPSPAEQRRALAVSTAVKGNADQAGEAQRLSAATALPADLVERNLELVRQNVEAKARTAALASAPTLGLQFENLDFAKVAHDDLDALIPIEKGFDFLKKGGSALAAGMVPRTNQALWGLAQAVTDTLSTAVGQPLAGKILPEDIFARMSEKIAQYRQEQAAVADAWRSGEKGAGIVESSIYSGLESTGLNLVTLPISVLTGQPELALGSMAATTGGIEYGNARDNNVPVGNALTYALSQAAVEYATEKIPVEKLLGDIKEGAGLWRTLWDQVKTEVPGEEIATVLQDLNQWATIDSNKGKTVADYLAERPSAALQTLIATLVSTGLQGGVTHAVVRGLESVAQQQTAAHQADQMAQLIRQLNALAEASKLHERNPQAFQQFVDAAADGGPVTDLYVNAATLYQEAQKAGVALPPTAAAQMQEALATKSDVRIPVGEYAATFAGTPAGEALAPHLRASPEALTQAEAQEFMQSSAEQFKQEAQKALDDTAWQESAQSVENELLTQLDKANRFTADVNKAYASLMANFYVTQAQRLGVTPEQLYVKYPLRIQAESPADGATMEQGADVAALPAAKINKELDRLDAEQSKLTDELIAAGRGNETAHETMAKSDPLAERFKALVARRRALRQEIDARYGPGAPSRLPKGFGPRQKLAQGPAKKASVLALENTLTPEQRKVYDSIPRAEVGTLTPQQVEIESRFAAKLAQDFDAAVAEYSAIPETQGGKVLNTDTARELSPDYLADRTQSNAVHEPASWFIKELYARKLAELANSPEQPIVLFTAGGTGAGKTTAVENIGAVQALAEQARIVYDTNMNKLGSAMEKLDQALKAGARAEIVLVYRHPVDALVNGALPRAERQRAEFGTGRTVPIDEHVKTHRGAPETVRQIAAAHASHPGVRVQAIDNSRGKGGAVLIDVAAVPALDYNQVEADVRAALEQEYANGRISEETYRGFAGVSEQVHPGAAGQGSGGRSAVSASDGRGPEQGHQPESLSQVNPAADRGSISFTPGGAIIALLQHADLSTFLHENGHFYLETLADIASQENAPAEIVDDMNKVLKWFGVKDLATWQAMSLDEKRPHHEQFARGFEAYLFEGKAPSTGLRALFGRFRAWMLNVYKSLTNLNVELTDEVRGVMDRLLASDQQIKDAEAARSYVPLFESAKAAGMTTDEWQRYQELGSQATQTAVDDLASKSLRNMQWLSNAKSRALKALQREADSKRAAIHREVTAEVRAEPVYAALNYMKKGDLPGFEGGKGVKLSLPALREMFAEAPEQTRAAISQFLTDHPDLTRETDGVHPDVVAQAFGFTSGDEMLQKIAAAHPEASEITGRTDQRMLERYGDLADPASIERAANEAIHNDARAKFVAVELKALAKATGQRSVLTTAARQFAEQTIARKKIRDVRPSQYEAAEARAARNATKAQTKGNLVEAAAEKRNQLVNNYATRAAYDALTAIDKGLRYLGKFNNETSRQGLDPDYLDQVDALLERFDLRKGQSLAAIDKRTTLAEWIKAQEDQGLTPVIPDELRNEAFRRHYKDLTVEEFKGLVDSVKNIEHLGRLKKKLLTAVKQRDFDAAVDAIRTSIVDNAKQTVEERRMSDRGVLVDAGKLFRTFFAEHRKFASLVREFDGWQDAGAGWEYLVRTMNDRGDFEAVEREKATIKLGELLAPVLKHKLGAKVYFPEIGKSFTYEERLGIALNMGNEVNRERVLTGEKLSPAQLDKVLGTLTEGDWQFVQGAWDYLETFRPQIAEKERRLTGVEPEWVEPTPVQTKFGEFKGGYYPIKYDPLRSSKSSADVAAEVQKQIEQGLYTRAQTRRGHLKARTESTGRPIRYDLGVLTEHVDQVIHDLAWHEYLIDANRLLRAAGIDSAIREHYGPEKLATMKSTLRDIATGTVGPQTAFGRVFNHLRFGATIAGLGWRLSTALLQPIGLTQSMVRIGSKWVVKGARHWLGDAVSFENSIAQINEKSDFMRLRAKTLQREINEIRNKVSGKTSAIEASYFYLIQKAQLAADVPTWWGAYEKAMGSPEMDEQTAVALADQAVRDAQGAGQIGDLAQIQRGQEGQKLFTVFYSFFNTTYNLTAEAVGRTDFKSPGSVALLAADLALLYTIPALLGTVLKVALKGTWDDEDKLLRQMIADQLNYLLGTMVGLRELGSAAQSALGLHADYTGPAAVRVFQDVKNLTQQAAQGELDAAFWKSLNSVGGDLFKYPAGQINQTAEGIAALANGETNNPLAVISGPAKR